MEQPARKQIAVVITDLDNTLYDWVEMWYTAFSALLEELVTRSGLPRELLESEIRTVFQRRGTSEYAFLIEELPSLQALHPGEDLLKRYRPAIRAYREARKATLRLYPSVLPTLQTLKQKDCLVIAYTESRRHYSLTRVRGLGLDGLLNCVYTSPDNALPDRSDATNALSGETTLLVTRQRDTVEGEKKPNPRLLLDILAHFGASVEQTLYVGDSLMKDVAMAQDAGVTDVYAQYGAAQNTEAYDLLRRVSHWTQADVERERAIYERGTVQPTYALPDGFGELLDLFDFVPYTSPDPGGK